MEVAQQAVTPAAPAPQAPVLPPLTQEERNDLRKRVLAGYHMTLQEAKQVLDTARQGQGIAAALAGEKKSRKGSSKQLSDEALDNDLKNLGI